jgi:hypothetical protein
MAGGPKNLFRLPAGLLSRHRLIVARYFFSTTLI